MTQQAVHSRKSSIFSVVEAASAVYDWHSDLRALAFGYANSNISQLSMSLAP